MANINHIIDSSLSSYHVELQGCAGYKRIAQAVHDTCFINPGHCHMSIKRYTRLTQYHFWEPRKTGVHQAYYLRGS